MASARFFTDADQKGTQEVYQDQEKGWTDLSDSLKKNVSSFCAGAKDKITLCKPAYVGKRTIVDGRGNQTVEDIWTACEDGITKALENTRTGWLSQKCENLTGSVRTPSSRALGPSQLAIDDLPDTNACHLIQDNDSYVKFKIEQIQLLDSETQAMPEEDMDGFLFADDDIDADFDAELADIAAEASQATLYVEDA